MAVFSGTQDEDDVIAEAVRQWLHSVRVTQVFEDGYDVLFRRICCINRFVKVANRSVFTSIATYKYRVA